MTKEMKEPPEELDGAKILQWAWSGKAPFGFIPFANSDDGEPIPVYGLAICQYDDSETVYRFSCDKNWEVQQDGDYNSVEEAIAGLPEQYKMVQAEWIARNNL